MNLVTATLSRKVLISFLIALTICFIVTGGFCLMLVLALHQHGLSLSNLQDLSMKREQMPMFSWLTAAISFFVLFWLGFGAISLPKTGRYIAGTFAGLLLALFLYTEWLAASGIAAFVAHVR